MMKLTILGSCSAYPTLDRFTTSQILEINGKSFLIDCGEGAQIQLRKNKIKFNSIEDILISHLHGDHFFGLPGLILTFNMTFLVLNLRSRVYEALIVEILAVRGLKHLREDKVCF